MTQNALRELPEGYIFFPANRWSWVAIKDTYRGFFQNGLNFWTRQNYDIPLADTVKVLVGLIAIESILQGLTNARFDFFSRFLGQLGGLFFQGILLGFILLMKEWLEARGSFREYLAFSTYARFILLPVALFSGLSSQLGLLLNFCGACWILYAFYKTFQVVLSRFLILVGIVGGIAAMGFLATLFAGLKLFV